MFGSLYFELAKLYGYTPREVDSLEVWEAAVLLGADTQDANKPIDHRELLRRRVEAAKTGGQVDVSDFVMSLDRANMVGNGAD